MDLAIILTIILIVLVILELDFTRHIIFISKNYDFGKIIELSSLKIVLKMLETANSDAYIKVFYPDNIFTFKIIKKQDSTHWWFEFQSKKQLEMNKYLVDFYNDDISKNNKTKNNENKFYLGTDIVKIQELIEKIIIEKYGNKKNHKIWVSCKNTRVLKSYEDIEKDFQRIN